MLKKLVLATTSVLAAFSSASAEEKAAESFKNVEIRVIRPRYFEKSLRLEGSAALGAVMNRSFTYSYMGIGALTFHITETIGLFGEGAYAVSFKKQDCSTLGSKFEIEPILDQLNWMAGGGLVYTPVYGKFQLASGNVLYFDWFFTAGGGVAEVEKRSEYTCIAGSKAPDATLSRNHFNYGTGQRFFVSKNVSLNWHLRAINVQPIDNEDASSVFSAPTTNILLSLGASYFL